MADASWSRSSGFSFVRVMRGESRDMRPPVWAGTVGRNGIFLPDNPKEMKAFTNSYKGQRVEVIVRKERKNRSLNQNAYYWAVIIQTLADEFGYDPEEMHEILLAEKSREYGDNPLAPPRIKRSSSMSTVEAEEYYGRVRRWALTEFQIRIPLPNELVGNS